MAPLVPAADAPLAAATVVVVGAVAAVYLYIGYRLSQRQVHPDARLASLQLALWWGGVGVMVALGGLELAFAVANALPLALATTFYSITVLVDCALLWGLVGFLVFVYTGKYHLVELTALYGAFYVLVVYAVAVESPTGVGFTAGMPAIVYAHTLPSWLIAPLILILVFPEFIGAVLYLTLYRRTTDRDRRFRILMVGGGILLWFLIDLIFPDTTAALALTRSVIQVIPGLMSLLAYFPPESLRRRFRLAEPAAGREDAADASPQG